MKTTRRARAHNEPAAVAATLACGERRTGLDERGDPVVFQVVQTRWTPSPKVWWPVRDGDDVRATQAAVLLLHYADAYDDNDGLLDEDVNRVLAVNRVVAVPSARATVAATQPNTKTTLRNVAPKAMPGAPQARLALQASGVTGSAANGSVDMASSARLSDAAWTLPSVSCHDATTIIRDDASPKSSQAPRARGAPARIASTSVGPASIAPVSIAPLSFAPLSFAEVRESSVHARSVHERSVHARNVHSISFIHCAVEARGGACAGCAAGRARPGGGAPIASFTDGNGVTIAAIVDPVAATLLACRDMARIAIRLTNGSVFSDVMCVRALPTSVASCNAIGACALGRIHTTCAVPDPSRCTPPAQWRFDGGL